MSTQSVDILLPTGTETFRARIVSGALVVEDPIYLRLYLESGDGPCNVTIQKLANRKSLSQLGYLWGPVYSKASQILTKWLREMVPEALPVLKEEAHATLKGKILGADDTHGIQIHRSLKPLDVTQRAAYIEGIRTLFAERGEYIPEANEKDPDPVVFR